MTRVRLTPILLALILAGCAATVPAPAPAPMDAPVTAPTQAMTAVGPVTARTLAPPYDTIRARPFDAGRMWTLDFPPLDYLERTYQFRPSQAWLDNVRLSALRFATWCSASFVSPQGLVLTNHHCSVPTFDDVQRTGEDFLTNGFYARTAAEERRVPGLFVEQLVSIEDVTPRLSAAMEGAGAEAERLSRQQALRRELEQPDSAARMRYQIVEFYNGGRYARYGYKRYDDVRLVFVPEQQIAFFGGDPDNFNYPRFALDMGLFRVYDEAGQALKPANYFRWSASGAELGEPVFVVGNPGSTQRQFTVAQLEYLRDVQQPAQLAVLAARRDAIRRIMQQDPVRGLELRDNLFSIENSIKAITGRVEGENDPALFARKVDFERSFRARIEASPELRARYGTTWDSIATLQEARRRLAPGLLYTAYLSSGPLGQAVALVRAAGGVQQLRGVALAADDRSAGEQVLELTYLLGAARDVVPEDSLLKMVLAGRIPEAAAQQIVSGYTLADTAARRALLDGGTAALAASNDPLVALARSVVPILEARQLAMAALQSRENLLRNRLGRGFYEVYGTDVPPDATFTLRLADGVIKGYEADGMIHPPFTTFFGLYNRAAGFSQRPPFDLPPRWQKRPQGLNLETRFNFVSTNDIIGGNSGSPLVNRNSEVVGLAFDGNLQSLPGNFIFDETENRTISVHSAG
ncbi:MAG: S46 family peptidase, partial [Gemmatimonadota bacterium]|nr:S46 family peptidase [Gemmatimonadota bacterium]